MQSVCAALCRPELHAEVCAAQGRHPGTHRLAPAGEGDCEGGRGVDWRAGVRGPEVVSAVLKTLAVDLRATDRAVVGVDERGVIRCGRVAQMAHGWAPRVGGELMVVRQGCVCVLGAGHAAQLTMTAVMGSTELEKPMAW
jgi:hypothetical protein